MFFAPYVLTGQDREAWLALPNDASRSFTQLFLHITSDRTHPYWGIRPLTVSHLADLWPGPRPLQPRSDPCPTCKRPMPTGAKRKDDPSRTLRGAVEAELLWRLRRKLP